MLILRDVLLQRNRTMCTYKDIELVELPKRQDRQRGLRSDAPRD